MSDYVLYTDGSASIRDDGTFLCGYAYVLVQDGDPVVGVARPGLGTVNQAEMCAVYAGVSDMMDCGISVSEVYTDSTYVAGGIKSNINKFHTGNWVNVNGSEVSNLDMWKSLCAYWDTLPNPPQVIHVKGHAGCTFNELCDQLAKEAAISQKPVICWYDIMKCGDIMIDIPHVSNPIPQPAVQSAVEEVHDPYFVDVVRAHSKISDDRAKTCLIKYPEMHALISRGIAVWHAMCEDGIGMANTLHPVRLSDSGTPELPLYRYRTELGTPIQITMGTGAVEWYGAGFRETLEKALNVWSGGDIIIATYNHTGAKSRGLQGIYILERKAEGGRILGIYRTDRPVHGKYMVISEEYISTLKYVLNETEGGVLGLGSNGDRYSLVYTSYENGIMIGSAILPTSVSCQGLKLVVKDAQVKVTFEDTSAAKQMVKDAFSAASPYARLEDIIKGPVKQDSGTSPEEQPQPNSDYTPFKLFQMPDTPIQTPPEEPSTPDTPRPRDIQALIDEYHRLAETISELSRQRDNLIHEILDAKFKYPEMTPQNVAEIESRVKSEILNKLNSIIV